MAQLYFVDLWPAEKGFDRSKERGRLIDLALALCDERVALGHSQSDRIDVSHEFIVAGLVNAIAGDQRSSGATALTHATGGDMCSNHSMTLPGSTESDRKLQLMRARSMVA